MNPAQSRQENVALPEAGTGDPDHIWIFREGAARADNFRLSTLPADVDDVAGFIHHIKNHYSVAYASVEADEIVIKHNSTGAVLSGSMKVRDLAGNSEETPYPVKVKGSSSSDIFSLIFKAIRPRPFNDSLDFSSGSSSSSAASSGLSKEPKGMVKSSSPLSRPFPQTYTHSNKQSKKNGSDVDGTVLRRRLIAVSEVKDDMYTEK